MQTGGKLKLMETVFDEGRLEERIDEGGQGVSQGVKVTSRQSHCDTAWLPIAWTPANQTA